MPVKVPRLDQPPHRCAFTLRDSDPEGFYLGETLSGWDPKAAISASYARSLARELGYVHPDKHQEYIEGLASAAAEIERLQAEVADLRAKFDAIDVIESEGFRARRKAGRPATTQAKEKV
jgi:hypothetical protein